MRYFLSFPELSDPIPIFISNLTIIKLAKKAIKNGLKYKIIAFDIICYFCNIVIIGGIQIPEIKFSAELEKFIEDKRTEMEQIILNCKYPLSIEDFAALAWERMEKKYSVETKGIDLLEAIRALKFEVSELIHHDKLCLYDWVPDHDCGGLIARYKTAS